MHYIKALVELPGDLYRAFPEFFHTLGKLALALAMAATAAYSIFYVVTKDDEELSRGKSPHSGFCPDYPEW